MKHTRTFSLPAKSGKGPDDRIVGHEEAPRDAGVYLSPGAEPWPFPQPLDPANKVYGDPMPAQALHDQAVDTGTVEAFGKLPVTDSKPAYKRPSRAKPKDNIGLDVMPASQSGLVNTDKPKHYQVVVHNNARTPFELVVATLKSPVFKLPERQAHDTMYAANDAGTRGWAKVKDKLTLDEAQSLAKQAEAFAKTLPNQHGGNLRFSAKFMAVV